MYGAIEAGGTKFVCAVGNSQLEIKEQAAFPTESPVKTIQNVLDFFQSFQLDALGIGSFGPIDIDPLSSHYGYIKNTPKQAWKNVDFLGKLKQVYDIPIGWTTDVNAAALGESTVGAGQNKTNVLYLTIGTGIGGGMVIDSTFLGGKMHPEMGHIPVKRHPQDSFAGSCPYHKNCLEGMASGPTIEARTGVEGSKIDDAHEVWSFLANYIAQALFNYTLTLRPDIIVLGGGVMDNKLLLSKVKEELSPMFNQYVDVPALDEYLVPPLLENKSGITGGLVLAEQVYDKN